MESDGDSKICTLLLSREATAGLAFGAAGGPRTQGLAGVWTMLPAARPTSHLAASHTVFFFFFFSTSLSFAREIRVALVRLGTAQQLQEERYPFLPSIFMCPDSGMAASVWEF